ncbi:MAG: RtcB family protein [Patescibacteria group bacterium]
MNNIRLIINDDYPLDSNTLDILKSMSQVEGIVKPIVALPDVHFKFSYYTPTGVVVLSKNTIIPKFVNANCGMSFIITPFFENDISEVILDKLFDYLRTNIAITTRISPLISVNDLSDIVKNGAEWVFDKHSLNRQDLLNFENNGSALKNDKRPMAKIMSFIPEYCKKIGLYSLGVLGYGNHFIELQKIDKVTNKPLADKFGISPGQLCFMIHSDSRAFGQSIYDFYSKKAKKLLGLQQVYKKIHYAIASSENSPEFIRNTLNLTNQALNRLKSTLYWKLDRINKKSSKFDAIGIETEEADAYITSTACAINFGYANRTYLASIIRDGFRKVFNKNAVDLTILYDGNHDSLQKETIDGNEFIVHRNGASRALSPQYFPNHPVFSYTGQPVLLPSALGRMSFLCAATKGCPESYYSACHGTGRLIDRGQARQIFKTQDVFNEVKKQNMKIYDYGKGYISEESPAAFKDAEKILETVINYNIADPVARLKPLAALKGWR